MNYAKKDAELFLKLNQKRKEFNLYMDCGDLNRGNLLLKELKALEKEFYSTTNIERAY